jgi:hypothetical protein
MDAFEQRRIRWNKNSRHSHTVAANAGYMRLYREIVLDVWRKKQGDSQKMQGALSRKVKELRENKIKLEEAMFVSDPLTLRRTRVCGEIGRGTDSRGNGTARCPS